MKSCAILNCAIFKVLNDNCIILTASQLRCYFAHSLTEFEFFFNFALDNERSQLVTMQIKMSILVISVNIYEKLSP